MKCPKSKLASPYVDGELSEKDKALFEEHARGCAACNSTISGYLALHAGFVTKSKDRAPLGFSARVMARVAEQKRPRIIAFPWLVRFAEAAVVVLMIAAGVISGGLLMNGGRGQQAGGVASLFSLDLFDPAPPDSVGGVYLAMTEADHGK